MPELNTWEDLDQSITEEEQKRIEAFWKNYSARTEIDYPCTWEQELDA